MFLVQDRSHAMTVRAKTRRRLTALSLGLALPSLCMTPMADAAAARVTTQVWVTGYTDRGYTASGVYTHPGSCAVDPRVIPLRTYIAIEGLGTCHAEDSGSAVIGYHIDVWVTTVAEAYAITGYRTASWTPASQQVLGFHEGNPAGKKPRARPTPTRTSPHAAPSPAPLYVTWTPVAGAATSTPSPAPTTTSVPPTDAPPAQTASPTPERVLATPTSTPAMSQPDPTRTPSPHIPTVYSTPTPVSYSVAYATWTPEPTVQIAYATWTPSAQLPAPHPTQTPSTAPGRTVASTPLAGSSCKTIRWSKEVHGIRYFHYKVTCR